MKNLSEFFKTTVGKIVLVAVPVALVAIIAVIILFLPGKETGYRTISISALEGTAKAEHNNKTYDAYLNMVLKEGYSLFTEKDSFVRMLLDQDKYIKLEENSKASFTNLGKNNDGYTVINLEYGAITNEITQPLSEEDDYIINTPNAVLAVRGTFFRVEVVKNAKGETLTDVYTYGGIVKSQRVLPTGVVVEEDVTIDGGYKATISMDTDDTIYITESLEEGKENVEPIVLSEIPEADIVDMYVASLNGHEMYITTEDIWENIEEREINVEDYRSNRDGSEIPKFEIETETESETESESEQHIHVPVSDNLAATCTEDGYERVICTSCGELFSETPLPATGHTEITTTIPATGEFPSKVVVSCSVCETILSEVEVEEGHVHTEETITTTPTCTTDGGVKIQCSVCHEILSETIEPATGHTSETIYLDPDCTSGGSKTVKCSTCDAILSAEVIPALGHTEQEETIDATFTSEGSYKKWCSVCGKVFKEHTLDKLPAIYTDDGSIYITPNGYYTSANGVNTPFVPYTGEYVISQIDPNRIVCDIYVEGGNHTITLDNINIKGVFDISADAVVCLKGSERLNSIESPSGVAAINNQATLQIDSGHYSCFSSGNGLKNSGLLSITGGSLELVGSTADMKGNSIYITGGSIRLANNTFDGTAYNGSTPLECVVYDHYPEDYELEFFSKEGLAHTYNLDEKDTASDGCYYVWKSAEDLVINENTFPDDELRTFIFTNFDQDGSGYLSKAERENPVQIITYDDITSFTGIHHFPNLKRIECSNLSTPTYIELRPMTKLESLLLTGAPMKEIDLSNCTELKRLDLSRSKIETLDLSSNTKLESLTLTSSTVNYINLENCTALTDIEVSGTNLTRLNTSNLTNLSSLSCSDTKISSLDLSKCTSLKTLNVSNCLLTHLDLSNTQVSSDTILADGNRYEAGGYAYGDFSMTYLGDIDTERISNVVGADYNSNGTLTNRTSDTVTYSYDCGNNVTVEFTLVFSY